MFRFLDSFRFIHFQHLSFHLFEHVFTRAIGCAKKPPGQNVMEDIVILLDAMKLRGEKIKEDDFDRACSTGSFLWHGLTS